MIEDNIRLYVKYTSIKKERHGSTSSKRVEAEIGQHDSAICWVEGWAITDIADEVGTPIPAGWEQEGPTRKNPGKAQSSRCQVLVKVHLFREFFLCGPSLKSLLNLLQYCFYFMFFGHEACEILVPQPEIETVPLAEILTTGPPGKSWRHRLEGGLETEELADSLLE